MHQFKRYLGTAPHLFGRAMMRLLWREIFDSYANATTGLIDVSNAGRFVSHVCERNNLLHDAESVTGNVALMFEEADADASGSIDFDEFLRYADTKKEFFGVLLPLPSLPTCTTSLDAPPMAHAGLTLEQVVSLLFERVDKDGSGLLGHSELSDLVRQVNEANGLSPEHEELRIEIQTCQSFGCLTQRQFETFVSKQSDLFKNYMIFQAIFRRFASGNGVMTAAHAVEFVAQVFVAKGQPIECAMAQTHARTMMLNADTDLSSAISFEEFLEFAGKDEDGWISALIHPRSDTASPLARLFDAVSALQFIAVCCHVLHCVLQCVVMCCIAFCIVLSCFALRFALCCHVLHCVLHCLLPVSWTRFVYYCVLQFVVMCCSVLQCLLPVPLIQFEDAVCCCGL